MSFETDFNPPAIHGEVEAGRSRKVRQHIENLKETLRHINWDMGELLLEATEKNYFSEWGFGSRKQYADEVLGIKERQIQYMISVIQGQRALGYKREELETIDFSKLREIFSLDHKGQWVNPETNIAEPLEEHIRRLITLAPSLSYEAILAEVRKLKGLVGDNDLTWLNLQYTRLTKDNVIMPGLNAFRNYMGSKGITGPDGSKEYTDAFVVEMMCAEVLSGAPVEEPEIQDETSFEEFPEEQSV